MTGSEGRRVLLAGATGLVGRAILDGLLRDESVGVVHVLARRDVPSSSAKVVTHVVDFRNLPEMPEVDEVHLALGTTIKTAGSQAAFRAVDFDANLAVARAAVRSGAKRCGLVSSMGADSRSGVFYSRVKGELEDALTGLGFAGLVVARPSLLVGDREALGQTARPMESFFTVLSRVFGWMIPRHYKPIEARHVAGALLRRVPSADGRVVLLSGELRS